MKADNIVIKSIPEDEKVELEGVLTVRQGFGLNMWHTFKFIMTNNAIWFRENKTNLIQFGIKDMCILYADIDSYKESNFIARKGLVFNYKNKKVSLGKYFLISLERKQSRFLINI